MSDVDKCHTSPPKARQRVQRRPAQRKRALLVLLLWAVGCAGTPTSDSNQAPPEPLLIGAEFAAPPYYLVEGRNGVRLLVMGTMHLGPSTGWEFSPAVRSGLEAADRFVLEVDLREATEDAVSTIVAERVILQPPDTLLTVVAPETARLLEERDAELTAYGMPANARLRLEPWFIATGLIELMAQQSGYSNVASAEQHIMNVLGDRPVRGLETFEEQIALLDDLPLPLQDLMLRDTLLRLDEGIEELQLLVEAWRLGDEAKLRELAYAGVDELPELAEFYEVLLDDRNARWVKALQPVLDDPERPAETVFVGVGALHLVGPMGLIDLFEQAGYSVHRLDHFTRLEDAAQ